MSCKLYDGITIWNLRCTVVRTAIGSEHRVFTVNCVQLCDCVAPVGARATHRTAAALAPRCHDTRHTPFGTSAHTRASRRSRRSTEPHALGMSMFPLGSVSPVVFQNQFRLTSLRSSLSHSQTHTPASSVYTLLSQRRGS